MIIIFTAGINMYHTQYKVFSFSVVISWNKCYSHIEQKNAYNLIESYILINKTLVIIIMKKLEKYFRMLLFVLR